MKKWWIAGAVVLLGGAMMALLARPPARATGLSTHNSTPAPSLAQQPSQPLRIAVIGGTKGVGRGVVELAASRGHKVTAMARREPEQAFFGPQITFTQGDLTHSKAVRELVANQDAVVFAVSTSPTGERVTVYSTGAKNLLAGAPATARIVMISGIGAGDSRGHGGFFYDRILQPRLLREDYDDKSRAEALLQASEASWTIVRPGFLTNGAPNSQYSVVADVTGVRTGSVARSDVAHFILSALESETYVRQTVLLTN